MGLHGASQCLVPDLLTPSPDETTSEKLLHRCPFEGCESRFETASRLKKHRMIHAERAMFMCDRDDCAKSFRLKAHLERHQKTPHVRIAKPKKKYVCSFCEKVWKNKFDLRLHVAVHTGNKPLKCDVCDAAFAKKSRLNEHLKTHHVYSCTFPDCQFEAEKWSLLRKHLPVHNVKCPLCSSKFKTQESLEKHISTHKSTFQCSQCDLQYAKRSSLNCHVRAVHEKVTFRCSIDGCGKEFAFKKSLRHHMRTHTDPQTVVKNSGSGVTVKRVAAAATLSGHEVGEAEKKIMLTQDKEFRINQSIAEKDPQVQVYTSE